MKTKYTEVTKEPKNKNYKYSHKLSISNKNLLIIHFILTLKILIIKISNKYIITKIQRSAEK